MTLCFTSESPAERSGHDRLAGTYSGPSSAAVIRPARAEEVRQFLGVGTGLPTYDNTHEVAQSVAPEPRGVYVDDDPMVFAHARALLV